VIVLDTNQLKHTQAPDGPLLTMLQKIAKETGHELTLPEFVIEEHLARYRHDVQEAYHRAVGAIRDLKTLAPYCEGTKPEVNVEMVVQERGDRLRTIFTPLPTPGWVPREALIRETRRLPPASSSWESKGEGARDVAIWLTAVHAAKDADSDVYFVSMDQRAFGKSDLHPQLQEELKERLGEGAARFRYCYGVEALLQQLATPYGKVPQREAIAAAEPVREAVLRSLATGSDAFFDLFGAVGLTCHGMVNTRVGTQELKLKSPGQVVAYQVGGEIWVCARPTWRAAEDLTAAFLDITPSRERKIRATFDVTTTLLMQLDGGGRIVAAEVTWRSRLSNIEPRVED
jgi:uncharacterized protein YihD (DUF1040 family)